MSDICILIASFTAPVHIPTDPWSLAWIFPLLAAIAAVYKATKMRVIIWPRFFREAVILFATLSGFMILAGAALIILVQWLTG